MWGASQVVQWWRIHLSMQETQEMQVWSLGQEDPLQKEMATHSSILAWKIPWTEEPGGLQSMGSQSQTWLSDWTHTHTHTHTWYASDISIKLFKTIQNRSWCQHLPESGLGSLWAHLAWAGLHLHFVPRGLPSQHPPAPARAQSDLKAWSRDPGKQVWGGCGCENLVWRVPHPSSPGTSLTTAACEQLVQVHGSIPLCQLHLECPALVLTLVWCWSPWGVSMFSGLLSHLVPHSPSSSQPSRGTTPRMAVSIKAQFISVQSLSRVQLFATPWIAACQASLSITNSGSSLRLTSVESVMLSSLAIGTQSLNSCLE